MDRQKVERQGDKYLDLFFLFYLATLFAYFDPVEVSVVWLIDDISRRVESQDVITHTARSARLLLVFMTEKFLSRQTTSIVQFVMCQNSQQSALPGVYIPNHSNPEKRDTYSMLASTSLFFGPIFR